MNSKAILKKIVALIDDQLDEQLPRHSEHSQTLVEAIRYAVLGGGKRLRGQMVCATTHALIGDYAVGLPAACAVESMHAYSLVHDDLPAMDDAASRRGKPSCHAKYGDALATLVGDALQPLAFSFILNHDRFSPGQQVSMCQTLAHAVGWQGMVGGQAWDLSLTGESPVTPQMLARLHDAKTGEVFQASVALGVLAAGEAVDSKVGQGLTHFSKKLGLAFQVVDDVLDCTQSEEITGKPSQLDADKGKQTYPVVLGLQESLELANTLLEGALNDLLSVGLRDSLLAQVAEDCVIRIR